MPCFLYQYPGDPEGFRRCQERDNPLGSQPWFIALPTAPGIPTPMPSAPPSAPSLPRSYPTPGTMEIEGKRVGTLTTEPRPKAGSFEDCDYKYPQGMSRFWCKLGNNMGFVWSNTGGAVLDKAASWAQYPVVILLGVSIVIIALVAIARPRIASIVQSDIGRATASVARVARR